MNLFELLLQLERIDRLIRTKSTGCPEEFARKFDMSERNASRLIGELRDQGLPIASGQTH